MNVSRRLWLLVASSLLLCLAAWFILGQPEYFDSAVNPWWSRWTAMASGHLLDLLGIDHLRDGPVIELPGLRLEVGQLAGSLLSPLVLLLCAALFAIWRRMTFVRAAVLITAVPLCSAVAAVLTIVATAWVFQVSGTDISAGWRAWVTGVTVLIFALGMLASTDRLILFFLGPILIPADDAARGVEWWNQHVAGAATLPLVFDDYVAELDAPDDEPGKSSLIGEAIQFLSQWFGTRNIRWLTLGAPVVLIAASVAITVAMDVSNLDATRERYVQASERAWERNDLPSADLLCRRVMQAEPENVDVQLRIALIAERRGDRAEARRIMQMLAPDEKGGTPEAHLWLARDLAGPDGHLTPHEMGIACRHLLHAIRSRPGMIEARVMLAMIYVNSGQASKAIEHLEAAVQQRPDLQLVLARVYQQQGDGLAANTLLHQASSYYRQRVEEKPQFVEPRLNWAQAELMLKNYESALVILAKGSVQSSDLRYTEMKAKVHIAQVDEQMNRTQPDREQVLEHLRKAARLTPDDKGVLNRLSAFAHQRDADRDKVRRLLEELVSSGHDSAMVRLGLGSIATDAGDFRTAAEHFERGLELDPHLPALANNLAWSLAKCEPPQLERALELANRAVEQGTSHPQNMAEFRITRGLLLVACERWREAIQDLESAVKVIRGRSEAHAALAKAYDELDMSEMSDIHHRLAIEQPPTHGVR